MSSRISLVTSQSDTWTGDTDIVRDGCSFDESHIYIFCLLLKWRTITITTMITALLLIRCGSKIKQLGPIFLFMSSPNWLSVYISKTASTYTQKADCVCPTTQCISTYVTDDILDAKKTYKVDLCYTKTVKVDKSLVLNKKSRSLYINVMSHLELVVG